MNTITKDRIKLIRSLQSALNNGFSEQEKHVIETIIDTIRVDDKQHFLSLSQEVPGKVTYAAKPDHKYNNDVRMRTTLRRYIRRQLTINTDEFNDKSLFDLGGYVKRITISEDDLDDRIQILKGTDIVDYYKNTDTESCMTGDHAWKVQIYADNPDKCSLVVLDDKVRALLWNTDDGETVLDRIYPSGCDAVAILQGWATRKGYVYRPSASFCDGMITLSDAKEHRVTLEHGDVFPYFDTFCYGELNYCDGTVVLSNSSAFGDTTFQSTSGGHSHSMQCCGCEENLSNDEARVVEGNVYCEYCFDEHFFYCAACYNAEQLENLIEINGSNYCQLCADSMFSLCNDCREYSEDTGCEVHSGNEVNWVCDECMDYYPQCSECGKHYERNQVIEVDGEEYCLQCHEAQIHSVCEEQVVA